MNILIVDDNIDLTNGLQEILSAEGHNVCVSYNAESALFTLDNKFFDVAFIDIKLPDMNGIELFRKIKNATPDTHVFIISGYRITQIIEKCTGIANTHILHECSNEDGLYNYVNNIDSIPLTIALADSNNYMEKLYSQLITMGKKPLILNDNEQIADNIKNYDILILNISKPLIYGLINFINIASQIHNIPTILMSDIVTSEHTQNRLHSFQLTGCLFKPFQLTIIIDIVDGIGQNKISANLNTYLN